MTSLNDKMTVLKIDTAGCETQSEAVWGGGNAPKEVKSKEQKKMDLDLLEFAFDGDEKEVKKLLEEGADFCEVDSRGNTALAEAAVAGHYDCCKILLEFNHPLGSDPNHVSKNDSALLCTGPLFQGISSWCS